MTMQMNEFFVGRNEPHWLKNDQLELPYDCQEEFEYPTSGRTPPIYEFSVPMCCAKCEEKVREELLEMDGIHEIFADQLSKTVVVTGFVNPLQALKKMKRIKKKSQFWGRSSAPSQTNNGSSHNKPHSRRHQATVYRTSPSQVTYNRQPSGTSSSNFRNNDGLLYSNLSNRNMQYGCYDDDISYSNLRPHTNSNNSYSSYDDRAFNSDVRGSSSSYIQGGLAPELRGSSSSLLSYLPQCQPLPYTTVPPFAQEYFTEEPVEEYPFYTHY